MRPRKMVHAPMLSPGEAMYVIERLVVDRRIESNEVERYVSAMRDEIADLEQRLHSLRSALSGGLAVRSSREERKGFVSVKRPRSRKAVPAEVRASQQLQGRYLGLISQFPKYKRSQYQRIAKERGREAAMSEMRVALGK